MNGTVKFFNETKGFGFIIGDDNNDYFVHISSILNQEEVREGDIVDFDVEEGDRGLKAINVKR